MAANDLKIISRRSTLFLGIYLAALVGAYESVGLGAVFPFVARQLGSSDNVAVYITALTSASFVSTIAAGKRLQYDNFVGTFIASTVFQLIGLSLCLVAQNNTIFVIGRSIQGLGQGALTVLIFFALTQFTETRSGRARALAGMSIAWLIPSLASPMILLVLPAESQWRIILVILILLSLTSGILVVCGRTAIRMPREILAESESKPHGDWLVSPALVVAAILIGAFSLAAQSFQPVWVGLVTGFALLVVLTLALWSGRLGLTSAYSMTVLGVLAVRGAVSSIYFTAMAYLPLVLAVVYLRDSFQIAVCIGISSIGWTVGAYYQARSRPRASALQLSLGMALVSVGISGIGGIFVLNESWIVLLPMIFGAGIGIGITNNVLPAFLGDLSSSSDIAETLAASESVDVIWTTLVISLVGMFVIPAVSSPNSGVVVASTYFTLGSIALLTSAMIRFLGTPRNSSETQKVDVRQL